MEVQFYGGPVDGEITEIPDATKIWVVHMPAMTPAEFVEATDRPTLLDFATMVPREFAYFRTETHGADGRRRFRYSGERVVK